MLEENMWKLNGGGVKSFGTLKRRRDRGGKVGSELMWHEIV